MPRFKHIEQIVQLMGDKEAIRNIGIIAHIDHGKTTLADSLLAGSGLLAPTMVGSARVLDFLEEEQKRKITIKTANITLFYKTTLKPYIINLVDTPGHVDFTGKVTRALRAIDGVVIVVDAVEEIMAQTEILMRQAFEERVKPVLFINKIDRLINELQFNTEQIQKKLDHIISSFNDLVEVYCEASYKDKWKIDPKMGNVVFGSALDGWGFNLDIARDKNIKFQDIIDIYRKRKSRDLGKSLPVYKAIFEMAIKCLPNPQEAQVYRIEKIWDGHVESKVGQSLSKCRDDGPTVLSVTNVKAKENGCIAEVRVFSGKIRKSDKLHLVESLSETTVESVSVGMGSFREEVEKISAGNLAAISLPVLIKPGETLVDSAHKKDMVPFEHINYVSEPVVTIAIEPKNPSDLPVLLSAMEKMASEDPNLIVYIGKDTGEYLLSGMGELHVEIAVNQLKRDFNIEVIASSPRVVYMESVSKQGTVAYAYGPNRLSSLSFQVEPELEELSKKEQQKKIGYDKGEILSIDEHRNALIDLNYKTEQVSEEILEAIISGFEYACKAGPLCGEPVRHVKANLIDLQLDTTDNPTEIRHGVGKAIFGSFLTAHPILLEPIFSITISVSSESAGECSRILTTKRGKIKFYEQKGLLTAIKGFIPVSETFSFSKELRSATSGKAVWQSIFNHWERMPEKLAREVITDLRKRKGLAVDVPKPEKFMG